MFGKFFATQEEVVAEVNSICYVPLEAISPNPDQPRRQFSDEELEELAASIREMGIIQPPVVCIKEGTFFLISGERRLRAARLAGLKEIPVFIKPEDQEWSAQAALIENIQRVDLNPLEVAEALRRLVDEFDLTQEALSVRLGKRRSTIANYLRLLSLPEEIRKGLMQEAITLGHAKVLLSIEDPAEQKRLYFRIIRERLSVRATESAVKNEEKRKERLLKAARNDSVFLRSLAEKMQHKFGTKVSIQGKGKRGRISIDYYNLDDLDRLLELFGLQQ